MGSGAGRDAESVSIQDEAGVSEGIYMCVYVYVQAGVSDEACDDGGGGGDDDDDDDGEKCCIG